MLTCLRCVQSFPYFFDFVFTALTRVDQDLAATETFYLLAKYDSVQSDALLLSAEDVETGANVQLPTSACLYVEQQTLSPTFVLEQLMFWFHQPQRKIDVLTLSGAGELPCPTNVLRCCMGAGLSAEEQQRHQDLLAGFAPPPSCRRIRLHQFATCLSKAFIGCAALCRSMKELQEATSFKGPNLLLCHNQATSMSERARAIVCSTALDSSQIPAQKTWHDAEQILDQKEEATFNKKRKRSVKVLYLVRWRGEPCSAASWEPKCNINAELFAEWTNSHRKSPAFRTASPIPASSDDAPAAPVSMFPYRSQEVGHSIDAMLTAADAKGAASAVAQNGVTHMDRYLDIMQSTATIEALQNKGVGDQGSSGEAKPNTSGCTTAFLGNMPFSVTEDDIHAHFGDCGEVTQVRFATDRDTGAFRGFGHVEFADADTCEKAVALAGMPLNGRELRIDYAEAPPPLPPPLPP